MGFSRFQFTGSPGPAVFAGWAGHPITVTTHAIASMRLFWGKQGIQMPLVWDINITKTTVDSSSQPVGLGDQVIWFCQAKSASITFTESGKTGPFKEASYGLGGTVTISDNGNTESYTVMTEASTAGTYAYEVAITSENSDGTTTTNTASATIIVEDLVNPDVPLPQPPQPPIPPPPEVPL
jgi:hypothetical protein